MASTGLPAIPSLGNTYGALYIGMVVAGALWGITTAQAYWYYTTYPKDPIGLKLLIATVWSLETVHQALITSLVYHYVIKNFFNPHALDQIIPTIWVQTVFENAPTFLVQCFFLMRIWRLSNRKCILLPLPAVFIVVKFAVSMVWISRVATSTSLTDANTHGGGLVKCAQGSAMAADILLAGILVYLLYTSRTGLTQTNTMINKLMLYAINTGVITGLCATATLVCIVASPNTFLYAIFYFCTGRLYVNSMLASLNTRQNLNQMTFLEMSLTGDLGSHSHDQTLNTNGERTKQTIPSGAFKESSKLGVYINTTHSTRGDDEV